ncbi:MAG: carboxypeptidase-like regulatory domain-containing protein, partial [Bacteroidetes bacterium]|nr:carboxypeptidase-like regulatory domain-containing protein [Bacteroidota bacterium]
MHRKIFYFLLFLALCPVLLTAGTRGRIKGKVVDLQTGEGLIGANVVVVGTTTGANTDANGEFLLQNLEAGVYTLKASYVGYKSITLLDVRVNADLTAYVSIQLPSEDIQVGTVEIVAQKPMIQKDATNAVRITTNDDIQALPVRGVNSIVGLTAGVVAQNGNLYIRGGRMDEVG